jgi:hypothetical protein
MLSVQSFMRQSAAAAVVLATMAPAHALVIETGSYANSGIGAEFASPYDNFVVTGATTTINTLTLPSALTLGTFAFEVGWNCNVCSLTPSYDALIDLTVDGVTNHLDLPYSWYSTGPTDFLTFSTPAPLMFDLGSQGWLTIAVDSLGTLSSSGSTVQGNVTGTVSLTPVPEPGTYALMLAGFAVIGFVARRRGR